MNNTVKQHYQIPLVKVVSFKVEDGFQASPQSRDLKVGIQTPPTGQQATEGTEAFEFGYF